MQILTIQIKFEAFESNSKHSNANSNHSKEIRSIWIQILMDLKHSNANSNHSNQIPSFERKFELFEWELNGNHSNQIQSIRKQILTIWIKFEAFECKF